MELKTPLFKKPYIELDNEQEKELFKLDKDKEIKRLKEEYMILQNASDKVEEEKDREIERLKEQLNDEIDDELKQSEIMVKQQNEIERLKDLCNKYEEEHKTTYEIWKKDIYLYNSLVDRIDKAIEYIDWVWNNTNKPTNTIVALRTLENILQGSDKE